MMSQSPDRLAMREYIYSLIDFSGVRSILDIGCGNGFDLIRMAEIAQQDNMKLTGIDSQSEAITTAQNEVKDDNRFSFEAISIDKKLPFADNSFDLIFSLNFLECVKDKESIVREVHRVLKKEGTVVFAHFDWDSQLVDGHDKDLVRKIVTTFGDWKQAWMDDADSWMGRRLWKTFNKTKLFQGRVESYVLKNTKFEPPYFGHTIIGGFQALADKGLISREEYTRFYNDLLKLAEQDEYFYSITLYIYIGNRIA